MEQYTPPRTDNVEANGAHPNIESTANFEGNWSETLFDRMQTPAVSQQVITLLHKEELARQEFLRTEPFKLDFVRDNGDRVLSDRSGSQILESDVIGFVPESPEQIRDEFSARLAEVMSFTPIDFQAISQPSSKRMTVNWENPYHPGVLTTRQMSMIEAHEKGHVLRPYGGAFFAQHFAPAFDPAKIIFTPEDYAAHALEAQKNRIDSKRLYPDAEHIEDSNMSIEEMKEEYISYLLSGSEIAERMAQLKNYFGMRSTEEFTKEHLAYAREHYLEDIDLDNGMTHFFQAITPETETKFLELANSSGI